jgi:hypothetical protein
VISGDGITHGKSLFLTGFLAWLGGLAGPWRSLN